MSQTNICIIFNKESVDVISSIIIQKGSGQPQLRTHAAMNYKTESPFQPWRSAPQSVLAAARGPENSEPNLTRKYMLIFLLTIFLTTLFNIKINRQQNILIAKTEGKILSYLFLQSIAAWHVTAVVQSHSGLPFTPLSVH